MRTSLLQGFLALLAPRHCPGCDLPLVAAAADPRSVVPEFCDACGPLLEPPPAWLAPPAAVAAAGLFQGPLADAIRRFKYAGAGWAAAPLGAVLARSARPYVGLVQAVVPLALHPSKLRERGYNPAALLARAVAVELGVPLRVGWLRRERATKSQAGLPRDARSANVRGAFSAPALPARKLLLIDDVRTTGATLAEASATLGSRGHEVLTLALAWSQG
jgi:predicted amidophosphoribosyltransferase